MIHVDRSSVAFPQELNDNATSPGAKERKKTAAFYNVKSNRDKPYDKYKAYKLPAVVKALNELFHAKCAYCETNIGATQPTDVEHFRPKGGYIIYNKVSKSFEFKRPGYHWLAACWENLLPSCIDCNRERTQDFPDGKFGLVGKANKFPLASERSRATNENEEKKERPLLLNPCVDHPNEHLEFIEKGIVRPALDKKRKESRRGKASIEVYGLLRIGLVKRRADRTTEVLAAIKRLKNAEFDLNNDPGNPRIEERIRDEILMLKFYIDPARDYSEMSRQLIEREYGRIPS